jgi:hypothetical protein
MPTAPVGRVAADARLGVVEEHALGWQGWAAGSLGRRIGVVPTWMDFWPTNGFLIVFGIAAAALGLWSYVAAADDGMLDAGTLVLGAAAMASVIVILVLQRRFRYPDVGLGAEAEMDRL